jgi:hypothetical protein
MVSFTPLVEKVEPEFPAITKAEAQKSIASFKPLNIPKPVFKAIGEATPVVLDALKELPASFVLDRTERAKNVRETSAQVKERLEKFEPTEFSLFIKAMRGNQEEFTEKDFGDKDLATLREVILAQGKTEGRLDYAPDWGVEEDQVNKLSIKEGFNAPKIRLARTLGEAKYKIADDGTIEVRDDYDFNPTATREAVRRFIQTGKWDEVLDDRSLVEWVGGVAFYIQEERREAGKSGKTPVRIKISSDKKD